MIRLSKINQSPKIVPLTILFGLVLLLSLFAYSFLDAGLSLPPYIIRKKENDQIGTNEGIKKEGSNRTDSSMESVNDQIDNREEQRFDCSSWRTYSGDLGGRAVMKYNKTQAGWKQTISAANCRKEGKCYPVKVSVEGVEGEVQPGVHNFTIRSQFTKDEFHVAMEGPELSPTFVESHGNGEYTASYCVELAGFYKLYVRIIQIDGSQSLRKDLFESPFTVRVRGSAEFPGGNPSPSNPTVLEHCQTARRASQGRWVRFDHAKRHNFISRFEEPQWEEVLNTIVDEYVWLPYSCRLKPMDLNGLRDLFQNRTHCLCCDSYIRTLFADALFVFGMINETQHFEKRSKLPNIHKNWELEGVSLSWHDYNNFGKCLMKRPNGISIYNILDTGISADWGKRFPNTSAKASETVALGGGKYVFFVGHPWSGDHRVAHRSNLALQRAQRSAYDFLPPEVDVFDVFAFTFPRIYHNACDGSHVSCVISNRLTVLAYWELLILAQLLL